MALFALYVSLCLCFLYKDTTHWILTHPNQYDIILTISAKTLFLNKATCFFPNFIEVQMTNEIL